MQGIHCSGVQELLRNNYLLLSGKIHYNYCDEVHCVYPWANLYMYSMPLSVVVVVLILRGLIYRTILFFPCGSLSVRLCCRDYICPDKAPYSKGRQPAMDATLVGWPCSQLISIQNLFCLSDSAFHSWNVAGGHSHLSYLAEYVGQWFVCLFVFIYFTRYTGISAFSCNRIVAGLSIKDEEYTSM